MPFPMQMQNGKINDVHFLQPGKSPLPVALRTPANPFNRRLTGELWLWNNRLFAMVWRPNRWLQAVCNKIFALSWNIETPSPNSRNQTPFLAAHGRPLPFSVSCSFALQLTASFLFLLFPYAWQFCMHFLPPPGKTQPPKATHPAPPTQPPQSPHPVTSSFRCCLHCHSCRFSSHSKFGLLWAELLAGLNVFAFYSHPPSAPPPPCICLFNSPAVKDIRRICLIAWEGTLGRP